MKKFKLDNEKLENEKDFLETLEYIKKTIDFLEIHLSKNDIRVLTVMFLDKIKDKNNNKDTLILLNESVNEFLQIIEN